jgi:hypothetical protein
MISSHNKRLAQLERVYAMSPFTAMELFVMSQRRATGQLTPKEYVALIDAGHLTIEELSDCELDLLIEHHVEYLSGAELQAIMGDVKSTM